VDNAEARAVASARLNELRAESYEELSRRLLGGLRAFIPLSEGFILTPHGTFVGE
jgi:hypothetical protein